MQTRTGIQVSLRSVPATALYELRHRELRKGLPAEAAEFKGDGFPSTRHYAVYVPETADPVRCVSYMRNFWRRKPSWQLRGMATREGWKGQGIGSLLLSLTERELRHEEPKLMWCNARADAIGFYQKAGWRLMSGVFDIPSAGPHREMCKLLRN